MTPYIIGAIVGAVLMGRTKAKMPIRTMQCFGPRTGVVWTAEILPGNDVVAIHAPGGDLTIALFQKGETGRFSLLRKLQGYDQTVALMKADLEA